MDGPESPASGPQLPLSGSGRRETESQRLDRNTIELLNEVRIAGTGIQVLFGFLLAVPFNARFARITPFERNTYYVTLLCVAVAAVLLVAPSIQHRIVFRRAQKDFVVKTGNRLVIIAMGFLTVGMTGIVVLVSDFVIDGTAAAIAGTATAVLTLTVWFAIPLAHRRRQRAAVSSPGDHG